MRLKRCLGYWAALCGGASLSVPWNNYLVGRPLWDSQRLLLTLAIVALPALLLAYGAAWWSAKGDHAGA